MQSHAAPKRHKGPAPRLTTAQLRRLPSAQDAVEVQAYLLRREGDTYADVCRMLEVGRELARTLVSEGAKVCVDEDPVTSLRLHLGRLEVLVSEWLARAFVAPVSGDAIAQAAMQGLPNPEPAARLDARRNTELVLRILAMQESIGTWLAELPRRGQDRQEEDDHAEIKAILLRAEEYGPPPGQGGMPHGLPHLDWRPADVEDAPSQDPRSHDAPQAPGGSGAETLPHTRPSTLW